MDSADLRYLAGEIDSLESSYKSTAISALATAGTTIAADSSWATIVDKISKANVVTTPATASSIASGKQAWVNGVLITGTGGDITDAYNRGLADAEDNTDLDCYLYSVSETQDPVANKEWLSVDVSGINHIKVTTTVGASHHGGYAIQGYKNHGNNYVPAHGEQVVIWTESPTGDIYDVSAFDSLVFRIECTGRGNTAFSQHGEFVCHVEKVD